MYALRNSMVLVAVLFGVAQAGSRTTVTVAVDAKTKAIACDHVVVATADDKDVIEVSTVAVAAAALDVSVSRTVRGKTTPVGSATLAAGAQALSPALALAAKPGDLIRIGNKDHSCQWSFTAPVPVAGPATKDAAKLEGDAPSTPATDTARRNDEALDLLASKGITDHEKTGHAWGHTYRLYHLPDGTPAFPLPRDLSEEDDLEPWIVKLASEAASVELTQCGDVPAVRISGTRPTVPGADPVNSLKGSEHVASDLRLVRLAAAFRCGESAAYKITTPRANPEVSLKLAPVYLFSWGVAYGFDFGRPSRIALVDRAGADGATEKVIVRTQERAGFRPMATLTWNACRANLKAWDLCDAFGLTAMADLSHLTEGGGIGVKVQPYPGLGVLLGMTFFQVDTLPTGSGLAVGRVFTQPGELPIHKQFTKGSLGLFLGVGGDTDTIKSLF